MTYSPPFDDDGMQMFNLAGPLIYRHHVQSWNAKNPPRQIVFDSQGHIIWDFMHDAHNED